MSEFDDLLLHVLVQLTVIIAAARAGAWLLGKVGQPQVVGEIVAGLALGPSLLGRLAPEIEQSLFPADTALVFRVIFSWLINRDHEVLGASALIGIAISALGVFAVTIDIDFLLGLVPLPSAVANGLRVTWP